jgi:hypothetical protein
LTIIHRDTRDLTGTSMMQRQNAAGRGVALAILTTVAAASATAAGAQSARPPLRQLGAAVATSEPLGAVTTLRQLPGGRLLVNDPVRRRVVMLDSMMKTIGVVADTTPMTQKAYGARGGGILAYRGDSTLFIDPASLSMLVIDPAGQIVRVKAAPRPDDINALMGGAQGFPGFDSQGRLVYRSFSFNRPRGAGGGPGGGGGFQPPTFPDSSAIVRFDLATRKLDTAAFIKVAAPRINMTEVDGRRQMSAVVNPMPEVDDWAVLPDGTIAIVRKDYHVDYIAADGTRTSGARVPFDWQRLTDSAKTAVIDSVRTSMERRGGGGMQALFGEGGFGGGFGGGGGGFGAGGGGGGGGFAGGARPARQGGAGGGDAAPPVRRDNAGAVATTPGTPAATGAAGAPAATPGAGGAAGRAARNNGPQLTLVAASELPDYRPAFTNGSVRADAEGKLWVRVLPAKPTGGGPEYDVLDRAGKLVDRVALPAGTTIAGFGTGGVVYLGVRDAAGVHVVRAREK